MFSVVTPIFPFCIAMYFIVSIFSLLITNFVPRSIRRKSATGRTGRTGHKAGRVLRRFCAQRKHIRFPFPCTETERAFLPAGLKQAGRSTRLQADSPFLRQGPGKAASAERRRPECCPEPEPAACIVPIYPQGFSEDTLHSLSGNALSSLPLPLRKDGGMSACIADCHRQHSNQRPITSQPVLTSTSVNARLQRYQAPFRNAFIYS